MITWDRLTKVVEIILLSIGIIYGYKAFAVYQSQAKIAVLNQLDEADAKLRQMQFDRPNVATLLADLNGSLQPKEQADLYLALAAECGYSKNNPCFPKDGLLPNWKTIPDLECVLWGGLNFNKKTNRKMRETYLHAEAVLYLVARAYERRNDIGLDEYDTWSTYIQDFGHHPLLLSAIHYGSLHGFISKDFYFELQRLLSKERSPRASKMIEAIYPQFGAGGPSAMRGRNACS